jgi:S-methylmethionine-dependent homocysteine/selenocysteine methylase
MKYRHNLPQLKGGLFLTDGGLETVLIFQEGIDLPAFAAVDLLKGDEGTETLRAYFRRFAGIAREHGAGFVLESPTWRASPGWAEEIGTTPEELEKLNRKSIALMEEVREEFETETAPIVVSGCIGPQGDGYNPESRMTADAAQDYHSAQVGTFADTAADMVTAITMTYAEEGVGIARAAAASGIPSVISFTVETDGRLPSGQPLGEAISQVDEETDGAPAYYMVNCAHPTHFEHVLDAPGRWGSRIRGLRPNASTKSHAELDEAEELDEGDPADLGARFAALRPRLPELNVLGGCCGTDHRHVEAIAKAWTAA